MASIITTAAGPAAGAITMLTAVAAAPSAAPEAMSFGFHRRIVANWTSEFIRTSLQEFLSDGHTHFATGQSPESDRIYAYRELMALMTRIQE
jgi:hypothetical protein